VNTARGISSVPPVESIHRVPRARVVDRANFLIRRSRGRTVIDLGFVDMGRMHSRLERGDWLHERLSRSARSLVGIDADEAGVAAARELGFDAHVADCESEESIRSLGLERADVVVAGELIEHLSCPGRFLEAARSLVAAQGELIITTPNATALTNVVAGLVRRELVNAEHVGWQSWHTATALLDRHGWVVRELAYYHLPKFAATRDVGREHRMRMHLFNGYQTVVRPLFRVWPSWSDGLIVVAERR
jgi:hypothetical protein